MTHDQDLQRLTKEYDDRHDWWEKIISRADTAQAQHFNTYRKASINQQEMEDIARGLNRATTIAKKSAHAYIGDIASLYSSQFALKQSIKNPLESIKATGKIARDKAGFWGKYKGYLDDGRYYRAEDMLESFEIDNMNFFRRTWYKLRYNQAERDAWQNDISAAKKNLGSYEDSCIRLVQVNDDIAAGEKIIARDMRKMLRNPDIQAMLHSPIAQRLAGRSPEFEFLAQCSAYGADIKKEDMEKALAAQQGEITPQGMYNAIANLNQQMRGSINESCDAELAARHRYEKTKSFASSARVTQRLETKTSKLVDGMYSDLRQSLKDGENFVDDEKLNLVRAAETKKRRWVNSASIESNVAALEKADFDPGDIKGTPWRDYAVNAGLDGIKRSATEFPVRALKASVEFARNLFRYTWGEAATGTTGNSTRSNTRTDAQPQQSPPPRDPKLTP